MFDNQALSIGKFLFLFQAVTPISLPPFKGGVFHGAFGHSLRRISPYWNHYFTAGSGGPKAPRPYVLLPPLDDSDTYLPGHEFACEMTIFGKAAMNWPVCHLALDHAATKLGLGRSRGRAKALGVEWARPTPGLEGPTPLLTASQIVEARLPSLSRKRLTLHLITRLRLKDGNRLVRKTPEFFVFFSRLLGRIKSLVRFFGGGMDSWMSREEEKKLLELSKSIETVETSLYWDDWSRYSTRQRSWMKFGGLLGSVTYQGDLGPFLPFLALGEWTHVGGKTSFGLGKYILGGNEDGQQEIPPA